MLRAVGRRGTRSEGSLWTYSVSSQLVLFDSFFTGSAKGSLPSGGDKGDPVNAHANENQLGVNYMAWEDRS